jgi:methylated-DNA-[protein]-cysteine S-methyltransferase
MNSQPELFYSTFETPAGTFSLAVDPTGSLVCTAFGGAEQLRLRAGRGVTLTEAPDATAAARREVDAYFADRTHVFRSPIAPQGSPFQQKVWAALNAIPVGETRSYGRLAKELQSSARAIGRANATNPVCLFVPCHRVIGENGQLTGYAFGEAVKARLLQHEGVAVDHSFRVRKAA